MRKEDIKLGETYTTRSDGVMVPVRVVGVRVVAPSAWTNGTRGRTVFSVVRLDNHKPLAPRAPIELFPARTP